MIQHDNIKEVDSYIVSSKISGLGFRKIATELLAKFGVQISHTTVQKYYKEHLNGQGIDTAINKLTREVAARYGEAGEAIKPVLNEDVTKRIRKNGRNVNKDIWNNDFKASQDVFADLYGQLVGLIAGNFEEHIQGRATLNLEYIRYLKELRSIYQKPFKA